MCAKGRRHAERPPSAAGQALRARLPGARLLSLGSGHLSRHASPLTGHTGRPPYLLPGLQAQAPPAQLAFLLLPTPPRRTHVQFWMRAPWLSPLMLLGLAVGEEGRPVLSAWAWRGESWTYGCSLEQGTCNLLSKGRASPINPTPQPQGVSFCIPWPAYNSVSCLQEQLPGS